MAVKLYHLAPYTRDESWSLITYNNYNNHDDHDNTNRNAHLYLHLHHRWNWPSAPPHHLERLPSNVGIDPERSTLEDEP